jgi:hypothetical protein
VDIIWIERFPSCMMGTVSSADTDTMPSIIKAAENERAGYLLTVTDYNPRHAGAKHRRTQV